LPKDIVVPVDDSVYMKHNIRHVSNVALNMGSDVTLLYVVARPIMIQAGRYLPPAPLEIEQFRRIGSEVSDEPERLQERPA
jgi:nucleotide-binding universal stress UspA family protein